MCVCVWRRESANTGFCGGIPRYAVFLREIYVSAQDCVCSSCAAWTDLTQHDGLKVADMHTAIHLQQHGSGVHVSSWY